MGEKIHLWAEKVGILREKRSSFAEKVLSFEGEKRYCGGGQCRIWRRKGVFVEKLSYCREKGGILVEQR